MTPADLVDLEWRLALDEGRTAAELTERDAGLAVGAGSPEAALVTWLGEWRRHRRPTPGQLFGRAIRLVQAFGMGLALAAGVTLAGALLHYDGGHPVNVLTYLWSAVGLQWGLLLLLALTGAAARICGGLGRVPLLGEVYDLLGALVAGVARRMSDGAGVEEWRARGTALWGRLRGRASLYASVESWLLLRVTQSVAAAFNVGLLTALVWQVAFTDLAFGWSTTLDVDGGRLASWAGAVATPWSALWPAAVPTPELIETTQYARDAGFAGSLDGSPVDARPWWRFLVAATVVYGLLPRVMLATAAVFLERGSLRNLPLDTPAVAAVLARIRSPRVSSSGDATSGGAPPAATRAAPAAAVRPQGRVVVVAWRGAEVGTHAVAVASLELGGPDHAEDERALTQLPSLQAESILVLAEAWEAPDAALRHALGRLRQAVGARVPVVVRLVGRSGGAATSRELEIWRDEVARLADPYTAVEAVS